MDSLPLNNLDEHLARFAASKKSKSIVSNTGNRQFTFRKSLSLHKNESTVRPALRSLQSTTKLSDTSINIIPPSSVPSVGPRNLNAINQPKKQQTITSIFSQNNSTALKKANLVPKVEKSAFKSIFPPLDSFDSFFDDLNDFDIPSSKSSNENNELNLKKDSAKEKLNSSKGNNEIANNNNLVNETSKLGQLGDLAGKNDSNNNKLSESTKSNSAASKSLLENIIDEDDEEDIICRSSKKKTILIESDDDVEFVCEQDDHNIPNQSCVPETQLLDCFEDENFEFEDVVFSSPSRSTVTNSATYVKPKFNECKPVPSTIVTKIAERSKQFTENKKQAILPLHIPNESIVKNVCPEISNFENDPLLQKSHFQADTIDKLQSDLSSLTDMNVSVMTKVCFLIEKEKSLLEKNKLLKSLIQTRNKILSQVEVVENVVAQKQKSSKSLFLSSTPTNLFKPNISSNVPSESKKYNFNTVLSSVQKLKSSPLFGSSHLNSTPKTMSSKEIKNSNNISSPLSVFEFERSQKSSSNVEPKIEPKIELKIAECDIYNKNNSIMIENLETQDFFDDFGDEDFDIDDADETLWKDTTSGSNQNSDFKVVAGTFQGNHRNDGASLQLKGTDFPHSKEMMSVFTNVFGLQKFRYNQLEAINAALIGEDCFILMPTGGGKSLCYQLPALLTSGVSIVVSPLLSLIMDQVQKLWSLDVPASHLSGDLDQAASENIYKQLASREPSLKLLFVTPEKISASHKLLSALEGLYSRNMLARFVIDEAHCVSQWGHDFRPDYKKLKVLRNKFPGVPMIALTATATPRVRTDILHQLNMKSPKWFLQSFNRPNLKYEVRPKKGKSVIQDIIELIKSKFRNMSGIVYCLSRNDCDNLASSLSTSGIKAIAYHAGLYNRNELQELWINDDFKVVCATIAFGMGIDKPDVRFVIHHAIPKSIEGYYQESGRAGRDGELSWCILYYNYSDMKRIKRMIQNDKANRHTWSTHFDNLFKMVHFCENKTDCRRVQMLEYFGEIFNKQLCLNDAKTGCDNCLSKEVFESLDVTEHAKAIVRCISDLVGQRNQRNFTLIYLIDIFKGSKTQKVMSAGHDKLSVHGRGSSFSRGDAERFLRKLVLDGYLEEKLIMNMDHPSSYVFLGKRAQELLQGKTKVIFSMMKDSRHPQTHQSVNIEIEDEEMKQLTERCYNELIEVSKTIASERKLHYTNVINVEALRQMSREMPMTEEDMLRIPHVTRVIYDKYGVQFLDVTQRHGAERCVIDAERADKDMMSAFVADEDDNWSDPPSPIAYKNTRFGKKRKKNTKGPPAKRSAKPSFAKNKKQQWKKARGGKSNKINSFSFGASQKSSASYNSFTKTGKSSTVSSSSRVPGFLPMPKPQGKAVGSKQVSRSFLPAPRVSSM